MFADRLSREGWTEWYAINIGAHQDMYVVENPAYAGLPCQQEAALDIFNKQRTCPSRHSSEG